MKLVIDNQLPQELAVYLRGRGHESSHVIDLGLDDADDLQLWTRCAADQAVLVSKDDDFVFLASRAGETGRLL
ncbi:MAG: DUF5615 family PIN-like protein [Tepidisphaeraceae bacterium]